MSDSSTKLLRGWWFDSNNNKINSKIIKLSQLIKNVTHNKIVRISSHWPSNSKTTETTASPTTRQCSPPPYNPSRTTLQPSRTTLVVHALLTFSYFSLKNLILRKIYFSNIWENLGKTCSKVFGKHDQIGSLQITDNSKKIEGMHTTIFAQFNIHGITINNKQC